MYQVFLETKNYEPFVHLVGDKAITGILAGVVQNENFLLKHFTSRAVIWGGPLCLSDDQVTINHLFEELNSKLKSKCLYVQFRNLFDILKFNNVFSSFGFKFEPHLNYLLDLTKNEDEIWSGMNKKRRNSIKKSLNSSLSIKEISNINDVELSYTVLSSVYKKAKIPLADFSLFSSAFKILKKKNMLCSFNVIYDNKCIGTLWTLTYKGRVYDWYSGSLSNYLDKYPNDFLIWHSIQKSLQENHSIFDFGGAGKPNISYGVRDFKRKFGGQEVQFGRFEKTFMPIRKTIMLNLFDIYKSIKL